jgi:hypothetical protein
MVAQDCTCQGRLRSSHSPIPQRPKEEVELGEERWKLLTLLPYVFKLASLQLVFLREEALLAEEVRIGLPLLK